MTDRNPNTAPAISYTPIGVLRSSLVDKRDAERQPRAAEQVAGEIHLHRGMDLEHAIEDLASWGFIWVLFHFDRVEGWRPKVLPPRSDVRRGVLATRSPHRPNAIGLSAMRLERVDGLVLHVTGVDVLDGTPVLDIKPYVPWTDAIPDANAGWLASPADQGRTFDVRFEPLADEQLSFLQTAFGVELRAALLRTLALGPAPHPYRRIRKRDDKLEVAIKAWRARFRVEDAVIVVESLTSGYTPRELARPEPALDAHRAFDARWPRGPC